MRILSCLLLFVVLMGCGRAWVVARYPDKGIIGYQGFTSTEKQDREIRELIHCVSYKIVADELKSASYTYTEYETIRSTQTHSGQIRNNWDYRDSVGYQAQTHSHTQIPVQKEGVQTWRELTYQCESE